MTVARSDAFNLLVNIQTQTDSNKHLFILTQTLKTNVNQKVKGRKLCTGIQES